MNCPQCQTALVMSERSGVEIDYCPRYRGIWLDRGELDKIIERASHDGDRNHHSQQRPVRCDEDDDHSVLRRLPAEEEWNDGSGTNPSEREIPRSALSVQ